MSMMKAELTAENRPALECGQRAYHNKGNAETHEYQGSVEILVVLLHVFGVVLHSLSFVHGVEVDLGIVALDWLEEHSEGLLEASWNQLASPSNRFRISEANAPARVDGDRFRTLLAAHRSILSRGRTGGTGRDSSC
jgi:hypothetical protein